MATRSGRPSISTPSRRRATGRAPRGTGWFHLYTAPREITGILGPTYFEHEYLDTNHAHDLFSFSTGGLVSLLDYVGDTKGNEAGTRTGVQVFFQPITVGLL